jgi:hypothetical protein
MQYCETLQWKHASDLVFPVMIPGNGGDDLIGGGMARQDLTTSGPGREGKGRPGLQS